MFFDMIAQVLHFRDHFWDIEVLVRVIEVSSDDSGEHQLKTNSEQI